MTEMLIQIFTWIGFLSVASTALLLAVTGWIYLLKKLRSRAE